MGNNISSKSNEALHLIRDLSQLSKVYIAAPIQQSKYDEILTELRASYRQSKQRFSTDDVTLITQLKGRIERKPQTHIEKKLRLLNFFQEEEYSEAKSYVKIKPYVIPSGTIVFHKVEYCVGIIVDWNPVQRAYKLIFCTDNCEWYKLDDLLVIGTCSKIWESTRATHCWKCKELLGIGDKKCRRCGWYKCPECRACNCNRT